ncbi:sigma-70 family RNA polymerase sigma factor [Marinobacterium lutimaris]|uniref:RNA polymerase sigma-70 factor, ECF subfamily n=1 Tax=Marinobacterium lutimaris TaxID=568106 RepID=A0A1H5WAR5_9GAMM|nr:sigma-70 family RNA polymerase sigma factor [Marinobacterium lutimaris]SEF96480.1 RNA polymerase sigma-70 factor, ECF subfamily [Marinobacterium lutimaris]
MEHYYNELVGYLTSRLCDRQRAADVAHDAYVRVLESGNLAVLDNPRAFLYRTAINLSIDLYRREKRLPLEPLEIVDTVDRSSLNEPEHPVSQLYQEQKTQLMQRALNELSDNCREAFLLRKLEKLSHAQIAERMQISTSMVQKHIVNAMKHCRIRVQELEAAQS